MSNTNQGIVVSRIGRDVQRARLMDAKHELSPSTPPHDLVPRPAEEPPTKASRDAVIASLSFSTQAATEYAVDLWQRGCLYADVMRERGNQYLEHLEQVVPNVLSFAYEPVMLGPQLARPVNYGLVRIIPPSSRRAFRYRKNGFHAELRQ